MGRWRLKIETLKLRFLSFFQNRNIHSQKHGFPLKKNSTKTKKEKKNSSKMRGLGYVSTMCAIKYNKQYGF